MKVFINDTPIKAKLWIFDKDGTLVSLDGWARIMDKRLKLIKQKYGDHAMEMVKPVLGFKGGKFDIKHILYTTRDETSRECAKILKRPQSEILSIFKEADKILNHGVFTPIKGAKRVLSMLYKSFNVVILTNDLEKRTSKILNDMDIPYHQVVGADTFGYHKPDPRLVFEIMKVFGIKNIKDVVIVGDSGHDIETGRKAGAISIGVLSGVEDKDGLKDADFIIGSVNDIKIKEVINESAKKYF